MEYKHVPVMPEEVLSALQPGAGERFADGTVGGGGHAALILTASSPGGWLGGSDRDDAAVEAASRRERRAVEDLEEKAKRRTMRGLYEFTQLKHIGIDISTT